MIRLFELWPAGHVEAVYESGDTLVSAIGETLADCLRRLAERLDQMESDECA